MIWPHIEGLEQVNSPGLLVDPDRVASNIQRMIEIVGGERHVSRLRPHVKTHKMPDAVRMHLHAGISKFKTATLTETEMVAAAGATDVLLAHQMVGPKIARLLSLMQAFPQTHFATIVDDEKIAKEIDVQFANSPLASEGRKIELYVDVDCGMHRTGIEFGKSVQSLRAQIESSRSAVFGGLHVYDGHIHDASVDTRRQRVEPIIDSVNEYAAQHGVPTVIAGGTPTFPMWASHSSYQCSPGTPILWDIGYGGDYQDMPFQVAAALVTRIISKPGPGMLCFDLGHKAISAEMPLEQRLVLSGLDDVAFVGHSEEHLVVSTPQADQVSVGDAFLAFPRHICPTVARFAEATIVRAGRVSEQKWSITARDH